MSAVRDQLANALNRRVNASSINRLLSKLAEHECGSISGFRFRPKETLLHGIATTQLSIDELERPSEVSNDLWDCFIEFLHDIEGKNTKQKVLKVNRDYNKALHAELRAKGFSVTKVIGGYTYKEAKNEEMYDKPKMKSEVMKEEAFFVANEKVEGDDGGELLDTLIQLGDEYCQEVIMYIRNGFDNPKLEASLHTTTGSKKGEVLDINTAGITSGRDLYSALEGWSRIKGKSLFFDESLGTLTTQQPDLFKVYRIK